MSESGFIKTEGNNILKQSKLCNGHASFSKVLKLALQKVSLIKEVMSLPSCSKHPMTSRVIVKFLGLVTLLTRTVMRLKLIVGSLAVSSGAKS